jgi:hypothetical protein
MATVWGGDRRGARWSGLCLGVFALLGVAGCGAAGEAPARDAATEFVTALQSSDAERACGLLAPDTVESLESLRPEGCPRVLLSLGLPSDPVTEIEVWGDAAQARTANDVLFLRELSDGWRLVAAGCRREDAERPYRCQVEAP